VIRTEVEAELRAEYGRDGLVYPAYGSYCFGSVAGTIQSLFGVDGGRSLPEDVFDCVETDVDRVLVVLVDGYGLDSWKRDHGDVPFLRRLSDRGTVTPVTSVYPSETTAAMNTYYTGALPCEHGGTGWNVYDPELGASFTPLPGEVKHVDDEVDLDEETIVDADPIADTLAESGVDVQYVVPFESTPDAATHNGYDDLEEAATTTTEALEGPGPRFVHAYVPAMDTVSHEHGTDSEQFQARIREVSDCIEAALDGLDPGTAASTLVVVTADHGHVNTDPERNVDLGSVPGLEDTLDTHADGTPIRMSGSPRNVHLRIEDGRVSEARELLEEHVDAHVRTATEALDTELFGDRPNSSVFERRLGDLVVSHRELGTWWGDQESEELRIVGMHGGLTPEEMLVPFAVARADRL
jgi:predicted AlkP superfamily pyrophosphatase or phosphodiesterase